MSTVVCIYRMKFFWQDCINVCFAPPPPPTNNNNTFCKPSSKKIQLLLFQRAQAVRSWADDDEYGGIYRMKCLWQDCLTVTAPPPPQIHTPAHSSDKIHLAVLYCAVGLMSTEASTE